MDVDEKPVVAGYSLLYVRILLGMLCLGVLRANENKPIYRNAVRESTT